MTNRAPRRTFISRGALSDTAALRRDVLGWNTLVTDADFGNNVQHVIAEMDSGLIVGCGSFGLQAATGTTPEAVRFWGIAVSEHAQSAGIGSRIIERILSEARQTGAATLWADARISAVPFYLQHGFVTDGVPFQDPLSGLQDFIVVAVLTGR